MKSKRLLFFEINYGDIELIHKGLSNPEITKFYGVHFETMEDTQEQMEWYQNLITKEKGIWWKLSTTESGEFIGAVGFNDWDREENSAEIGCWLLKDFWGKGFGSEALERAMQFGINEMKLEKILGFIDSENTGIKKVLEKIGFKHFDTVKTVDEKNSNQIDLMKFKFEGKS